MTLELPNSQRESIRSRILLGLVFWAALVGLALWFIYPERPCDFVGWLLLVFVGVPVILLLELLGEIISSRRSKKTWRKKDPFLGRVFMVLLLFLVVIVAGIAFWIDSQETTGSFFEKVGDFLDSHFCEW